MEQKQLDSIIDPTKSASLEEVVALHFRSLKLPPPSSETVGFRESGLTSLQVVDLVLLIEECLDLKISEDEMTPENFYSTRSILQMVERLNALGGAK